MSYDNNNDSYVKIFVHVQNGILTLKDLSRNIGVTVPIRDLPEGVAYEMENHSNVVLRNTSTFRNSQMYKRMKLVHMYLYEHGERL